MLLALISRKVKVLFVSKTLTIALTPSSPILLFPSLSVVRVLFISKTLAIALAPICPILSPDRFNVVSVLPDSTIVLAKLIVPLVPIPL